MSKGGLNKVQLEGVLGFDPRLTYVGQGTAKVWTKLIVDDGEYNGKAKQIWIPLTIWGDRAEEFANAGYGKGDRIKVEGKYNVNRWKPQGSEEWKEDHGVVVFSWEGTARGMESLGEELTFNDDDPFDGPVPF